MVWIKCQEVTIKAAMWIPIAAIIEGKGTVKGLNSYERDEKGIKMSALITSNHVDFGYENHDAVVDLTMEVDSGDYLCVVGENGSGKSTLMKGLLGLIKPTAGTLTVAEELKKTGIGYLPQQTAAQKDFPATVYEVVISGCLSRRGHPAVLLHGGEEDGADQHGKAGHHPSGEKVLPGIIWRTAAACPDCQGFMRHQ